MKHTIKTPRFRKHSLLFSVFSLFLTMNFPGLLTAQTGTGASAAAPKFTVLPGAVRPGEPFVAAVSGFIPPAGAAAAVSASGESSGGASQPAPMRVLLLSSGGRQLGAANLFDLELESKRGSVQAALLAVPSTAAPGKTSLRLVSGTRVLGEIPFTISDRKFETETIAITGSMTDILTVPDPQKTQEARELWAILAHTGRDLYTTGNFILPVNSRVQTSRYGGRRVYKYPDGRSSSSIHAGIDYRAPTGTPISACAPGKVVLAKFRIVTGNTVIIEHMPGVYSLCYHMNKITVSAGDIVQTGTRLGDSGATGFATGAHLHWEVRVAAENTDPESFLGRVILDKDAILDIMNE
jgi:murein DD-endopeptidase MepM/ murein hydrolase activator NlpD